MAPPILFLRDIRLSFGGTPLLEGADLSVSEGQRICLVGRNGAGKSTLLKIAAGIVEADGGERFVQPGTTLRYLTQEPDLTGFATTGDFVRAGLTPGDDAHRANHLLEQLGLTGDENTGHISGGETRRAALAQAMAPAPDILLLDEPTNHLDLPAIEWLERELAATRSALVLISHDRRFLETLSNTTVWLDRGQSRELDQGFSGFEAWRDEVLEQEETERHKLARKIVREEHWITYGVTARRKRNQGRLRKLRDLRSQHAEQRRATGNVSFTTTESGMSGKLVAEAKGVSKTFGAGPLIGDLNLRVMRGDRLGLVGPNGSGKTTLVNLLTGVLAPDAGTLRLGANLETVMLDQRRDALDANWTLTEALTGGEGNTVFAGGQARHVIGYMKDFLFSPEQAGTPISALSGGERGRLMLARALAKPSNLLILDEPTNDLDLETLELLQEMLSDYPGTVLLVSHDRDFLDRVCTSVLAPAGDGEWHEYAGGYSDMLAQGGGRWGGDATDRGPPKEPRAASRSTPSSPDKQASRMTYKDKHALETLPARMEKLAADIARHQTALADGDLFKRDADAFQTAVDGLKSAESELAAAEEQWLTLELRREELEGD